MQRSEFARKIIAFDEQKSKHKDYWLNQLAGTTGKSNFPYNYKKQEDVVYAYKEGNVNFTFTGQSCVDLLKLAKESNYKLHVILAAALTLLLYKYTGNSDIITGTPIYKQENPGDFINTVLPLRVQLEEKTTFKELLLSTREIIAAAVEHQNFPIELLWEQLNLGEDLLFDVFILLENTHDRDYIRHIGPGMTFIFSREKDTIRGTLEYNAVLYEEGMARQIMGHYLRLVELISANIDVPVEKIDLLSTAEKEQLLFIFNDTQTDYPAHLSVPDLLREQAGKNPYHTALVFQDEVMTYHALQVMAGQVAGYLLHKNSVKEAPIGIIMDKSPDIIVVIAGILMAGCAYVPIDVSLPEERMKWIIDDTGISIIFGHKRYIKILNRLQWECRSFHTFLCFDSKNVYAEEEIEKSELMGKNLWEYVGGTSKDDITAGGWLSSYTGEPIPKQEMDEYGDNALLKLSPILHDQMEVLDIGCSSGLTMYRVAPKVARYHGTDLSSVIIEKNKERVEKEGIKNITLSCLPAHDIDRLAGQTFDLIIINSVIQCFHGHNYLRKVLFKALDLLKPKGYLFIGDIMDQDLKKALIHEMTVFKRENIGKNYKTKTDWSTELFISRGFLEDFVAGYEIFASVAFSTKIYTIENELTRFRYDALVTVDKSQPPQHRKPKHKCQHDQKELKYDYFTSPLPQVDPGNLAYIMYTSGSTGKAKGVLVKHQNVARLVKNTNYISFQPGSRILQTGAIEFDASTFEIWGALLNGLVLCLAGKDNIIIPGNLKETIRKYRVNIMWMTSALFNQMADADVTVFEKVESLIVGGDELSREHISCVLARFPGLDIINGYGPTENTTFSTTYAIKKGYRDKIPIGSPVANSTAYILDAGQRLVPVNVPGELCVGGDGLSRGYLNNPELTNKSFSGVLGGKIRVFQKSPLVYRTGDLARWLPGGVIEFLGRVDHQVKIRGFRVELGEIESKLLLMDGVREAVVTAKADAAGDRCLCAFITAHREFDSKEIREYLELRLPLYMVPAYFTQLEKMPLNPNGKVDRKALAKFEIKTGQGEASTRPRDYHEETLARIWAEVLKMDKSTIGIDDDFFALGGHSLRATVIISNIHKELNIKVPLAEIFKTPTIRELANYIKTKKQDIFISILPAEEREYYVLSSAQKRLYILQQMREGNMGYNEYAVLELQGRVDKSKLEKTFKKLIARHESFRTYFVRVEDEIVQRVAPGVEFYVDYTEVEEDGLGDCLEKVMEGFIRPFDLAEAPLLRVKLVRFGPGRYWMIYDIHHIITDGTSMAVLVKEFAALYAGMLLEPLRLQYKDFSQWQNSKVGKEALKTQESYWLRQFHEEIPVLNLYTDYPRPECQGFAGDRVQFVLSEKETRELKACALKQEATIFMLLLGVYNVLLSRLSGQQDVVVGTPVAARRHADLQCIIGMFVNTLALRNYPVGAKCFSDFLKEIKARTLEAFENQEYPFEELVEKVVVQRDMGRNPLFDTIFAVQNMESQAAGIPEVRIEDLELKWPHFSHKISKFDLSLHVSEGDEVLFFILEYSTALFKKETIERFYRHFISLALNSAAAPLKKIHDLDIISDEEKEYILNHFNNTYVDYPREKTIHQLFAEQAERNPDHISLVGAGLRLCPARNVCPGCLTYRQLNEQSDRLAGLLIEKGVLPGNIVGIKIERSVDMIIGLLGILKSGGAYLPIDPEYPQERIDYMLKDSAASILLTNVEKEKTDNCQLPMSECHRRGFQHSAFDLPRARHSNHLCYIIYTSGSTGKPKGVLTMHANVVRVVRNTNYIDIVPGDRILQLSNYAFDGSVFDIYGALLNGAALILINKENVSAANRLAEALLRDQITVFFVTTALFNVLVKLEQESLKNIRKILFGGERVSLEHVGKALEYLGKEKIIHVYGPTETTVYATYYFIDNIENNAVTIPIGKPISNTTVYILDKYLTPVTIGVPGEIYIGGPGVARGYLNNPELTAERFIKYRSYGSYKTYIHYKTGDLARWLPDGNIEFLGRIDHQVKLRGFRVELGEIENRLLKYPGIKGSLVLDREEKNGDKYLCAYIVSIHENIIPGLREYLAKELPGYMIPSYFVQLEKFPLTPNGKIDRKALPKPELKSGDSYIAPRDEIEKKLVEIWSNVLGRDELHAVQLETSIGIDDNFFQLGGHSLKATILVSKIHKLFQVNIPLTEIFKTPTIQELANYIKTSFKNKFVSIYPVEKRKYYPLSSAQKRLYILYQLEPQGVGYNIPFFSILEGEIDKKKLERTFRQLIHRHESLRTSFHIIGDEPVQNIHDNVKFEIEKLDGRVDPLWSPFIRPFALSQAPLLRVGLLKEKEARHILMVDMHHIISDGTSMNILVKDFMALYQGKHLSELQLQYKDFSNWQQDEKQAESLKRQEEFWLNEFAAEIPVLELHVDYQRPAVQSFEGSRIQFEIDKETTAILKALTLKKGATLYILLLTLYTVFLSKVTGQEEIIIGSPIAGRRHADLEKIIGMFVNTLALRNYPVGEKKFPDFLEEVKEKTLKAFENQDYQYELLVEKVAVTRDTSRNPLFDTMFALQNIDSQNIDIPGLKIFPYPYENKTAKFDLSLSAVEWEEKLLFDFEFSTKLFKEETINRFIAYFRNIVNGVIENKERKIADFEILTEEEKRQILGDFNDTAAQYPRDITIHQLFEEQALKSPDHVAVFGHGQTRTNTDKNNVGAGPRVCPVNLTYRQLNEQSDRLANSLIEKGVLPDTIVGIMMERSVEIIIGILGILKSGGAYLPIDPEYPQERIDYMLKDSAAKLLVVANDQECEKVRRWGGEKMILKSIPHLSNYSFYQHSAFITQHSNHLCYIIYTSGSTGKPKGVLIQHDNFVNATFGWREEYKLDKIEVNLLQMASFSFDVSCGDISRALINGGKLIICSNDVKLNFPILYDYIDMHRVTLFESTPSLVIPFMDFIHENKLKLNYLQLLIIGSDSFRFTDYQKLQSQYGKSIRIINSYGVTEATIDSTYYESIDEDGGLTISEFVPIGKPMPNVKCFILDSYCRIQPIGISGELFITGSSISRGYANRPELTCKKFKIINYKLKIINGSGDLRADLDAYSAEENFHHSAFDIPRTQHSNFYATGDLARWLPDGSIEFLGRIDHQIKIRGFRLELGEIESHLCSHGAVKKGIVRARDDGYGNRYLCAYVVMEDKTGVQGLKEYLKKKLPDYMIPMYFVPLAKIPLTLNGKVDSRALPEPAALEPDSNYIAPRDHIEIKLAEIWSGVLKINQSAISIDDDFFQVGGHSLRATIVISNIHKELNIKLPLVEIFKSPTIRALAHYIKGKTQDKFMAIPAVEKMEYYPLSPAQGRLYFLQQITEGNTGYNEYSVVEIVGQVDKCKLEETFKKLIDRHESFRTYFVKVGDEIRQRVAPIVDFVVDYEEEENEKLETVLDHFIRPFDLGKAPLLRVKLVRFNVEHYWMLYDMHHIITDGTSTAVLLKEFVSFYVGESLEPLRIQYKDFSLWQDGVEGKAALKKQESYWLKEFQAEIPVLQLCTDYPRPELQRFAGDRLNFILGEKETKTLKVFTLKQDVTLFMLLLGVYNVLLSRLSGQEDLIVGTPIAARRHADLQCIIGMFVNTLALRNYPVGDKRFIDFLGEIKNRTLAAFENQEYPFEELVEKVKVPRNLGRNPVFDIIIAVQNMESQVAGIPEARIDDIEIKLPQFFYKIAKFDLSMHVIETGETLAFILEYSTSLFKKETVEQFYHYFVRAALAAAGDPLMKIYELEIISNDEKRQILYGFNDTDAEYPWEKTIYGVFKEQAVRTPDFTAVIDNDALVTYRELNEKSDRLSYLLRLRRVGTNTIVGIMAERSIAMIQGIFAILKTGGAYLPIEPDYPGKRVDFILADAGVEIVLTQQSFPERILKNCEKIFLDGRQSYAVDKSYACLANKPGDLIYIIYTSGSTGKPKGVMIEHGSAINILSYLNKEYPLDKRDVYLFKTPYIFDVSVSEIFGWFWQGGRLAILKNAAEKDIRLITTVIAAQGVTHINFVPSMFHEFLGILDPEIIKNIHGLKYIFLAGEALGVNAVKRFKELGSGIILENIYGPTEGTIYASKYSLLSWNGENNIPIGRPVQNTRLYILNHYMQVVPAGVLGELHLSGTCLARGYLNNPELTAENFKKHRSYRTHKTYIFYKTGDLVRYRPNGDIEYLGRIDRQIKIRGFRIELDEIKNRIRSFPKIKEVEVVLNPKNQLLCAYIVGEDDPVDTSALKNYLMNELPSYMIPECIMKLERMPLNTNGKIDWQALPDPETGSAEYTAPRSEIEKILVQTWSEVLGIEVEKISIDDNFFDRGGNSLKIIRLQDKLHKVFKKEFPLLIFFKYTTIRTMAEYFSVKEGQEKKEKEVIKINDEKVTHEIAVIGLAGRFPGAPDVGKFWQNLENGIESLIFYTDEELRSSGIADEILANPNYVKAGGGPLEDADCFDAAFFGYAPAEAEIMDPQIRIFHECSWTALENAGYYPGNYMGRIGLYAGGSPYFNWEALAFLSGKAGALGIFEAYTLSNKDFLCARVSYKLNLRGPVIDIDTACSTSLVAVHLACRGLSAGECDMALAGGAGITLHTPSGYWYQEGMIFSRDGHCRAFDAQASGTIGGDGAGVVVLKKLSAALKDRDNIYAVIKGTAINNDGFSRAGFTAPSIDGQAGVIRAALDLAGIEPESIGYIETHGTGTAIGDPIEIEALKLAFNTTKRKFCAIGAVKSNIGHLNGAAGIAGFIKTVLALKNKKIPPSLHFQTPNPRINFDNSPFYVNVTLQEWQSSGDPLRPRRAGVSSFGIGGTNAHVILEEAPAPLMLAKNESREYRLLLLSAAAEATLVKMSENLAGYLQENTGLHLADVAYTLQTGRKALKHRFMTVCAHRQEAVTALSTLNEDPGKIQALSAKDEARPLIFMFPGVGAQYVDMGKELYDQEKIFRDEMNRCFEIILSLTNLDIQEILYPVGERRQAENLLDIQQPEIFHVIIFIIEYSLATLLIRWGIKPRAMIGYSLGEYAAACLSGVLSLQDALAMIVYRGQLIKNMPPGAMLSVPLPRDQVNLLLKEELGIAIDNGPSCVVAGPKAAVIEFEAIMKEKKIMCIWLPGRQAIHSEMMAPVAAKFKEYMARFSFHKPQIPYISNVTGKWLTGRDTVGPLYWARHLQETVRFADGINELIKEPDAIFVEIGPGRDLSSLIKRYTENNPGQKVINMLKPAQSNIPDMSYLLKKIGFLWLWGVKIDWDQFYLYEKRCRVPLPAYPFEKHSYSLLNNESFKTGAGFLEGRFFRGGKRESNERLYIPSWKRIRGLSLSQDEARQAPEKSPWLILIDQMGIGDGLAKKLGHEGHDVITVEAGEISTGFQKKTDRHFMINPGKEHDACWDELFNELEKLGLLPRKIIHCWCITPNGNAGDLETGNVNQFQDLGYYSLLNIARALGKQDLKNKFHIAVISNNMQEVSGEENLCPAKSTLLGPVKVIPFEYANITCQSIDITVPSVLAGSKQAGKSINQLTGELLAKSFEPVMALRGSHLWVQTFEHILLPGPGEKTMPLKQGGVYLITGGLGGIGMAIAKYLAEHFRARLILIGRTAITRLPGQPVENKDIQELEQLGAQVLVFSADVSNLDHMQNVIAQAVTHFGQIHGVIHAAVVPDGAVIQRRTRETSERIFTSKIAGTIVLAQVLADIPLDFFVLCSSINAVLGGIGQVGYCAANNFLDAFAAFQFAAKGIPMVSINWERWQNTGIARIGEAMHKKLTGEDLAGGITPAAGWDYLLRIISDPMPQVLVSDFDLLKQFKTVSAVPAVSSPPAAQNIEAVIDAAGISRDPAKKAHHRPALAAEYAPPRYDMERDLIRTWSDFFGYEKIGIYDDFFELGGDSLKAIVLTTRIHKELHIKISLADIFRNPTIALLAGYLKDKNKDEEYYGITSAQKCNSAMPDRANKFQEIEPVEKRQYYPQSAAQKRFFFLEQFENINSSCHIFFAFTVEGQLNIQRLRQALKNLFECHEALRTSFRIYNNELIQVISEKEMVEFDIEYLQVLQNELEGIIKNFSRPFDISRAPLLRVGVCELSPGRYILLYDIHHIIGDGISLEIMVEDFFKFYNGEILPVPALQYKDFAVWQDKLYKSGELKKQEEYWLNLFSGEIPHLNLPYDYPREAYISFQGDNYLFNLGKEITGQLNAIGLEAGATVYMNLLALLNILFYHYTSQKDIVIGTGIMGRSHASLHRIAGIFVNMLAMRNYPAGEKTYLEFLQEVKENCIKAFDNQDFPFDELIDKLKLSKSLSLSPLFDVELSLTNYETAKIQQEYLDDLKIYPYNFENKNTKFDLILYANEIEDGMHFVFKYATALFRKDTIEKLARHFIEITEQVTANKEIKISNIILSHELVLLKQPGLDEETTADFNF